MKKITLIMITAILITVLIISCQTDTQTGFKWPVIPDSIYNAIPELPCNPAMAFVRNMGLGINIGNSLDAIGTFTWHAGERGWGNPEITQTYVQAIKKHGFKKENC